MKRKLTINEAVRIAYECGRAFRDVAGQCGGVGAPWDDLTEEQKADALNEFFAKEGPEARMDQKMVNLLSPFLQKLIYTEP